MPDLSQSFDAPSTAPLSLAPLHLARFRGALDWMLAHPLWEDHFACSLEDLGLKGQRQGIAQRTALRSLPLERKQALVRHALDQGLPSPRHSEAIRFARNWGITQYRGRSDFDRPSAKQWQALLRSVLIRIAAGYEKYKEAQSELYAHYQHLPVEGALSICRTPAHRADACQEARLALLEAIDRIDPSENFEAYARQWIRRRILNFSMRERVPVKAPVNLLSKCLREESAENSDLDKALRQGTVRLDDETSLCPDLHSELATDAEHAPDHLAMAADNRKLVAAALSNLTLKQREVLELRFGLGPNLGGQSLSQIAQQTGISRQQVFQREKRALQTLRTSLASLQSERAAPFQAASRY